MIKKIVELSQNNQLRIFETSSFLKLACGSSTSENQVWDELRVMLKTPKEWRRYRKGLFNRVNVIREKMGLKRLGV